MEKMEDNKDIELSDLKKQIYDEAVNVRIEYERSGSNLDKENIIFIHQDSPHLQEEE